MENPERKFLTTVVTAGGNVGHWHYTLANRFFWENLRLERVSKTAYYFFQYFNMHFSIQ